MRSKSFTTAVGRGGQSLQAGHGDSQRAELHDAMRQMHVGNHTAGATQQQAVVRNVGRLFQRCAEVIECRFFGGYSEEDTARTLGLSLRTVQRDCLKARAWLYRELGGVL